MWVGAIWFAFWKLASALSYWPRSRYMTPWSVSTSGFFGSSSSALP